MFRRSNCLLTACYRNIKHMAGLNMVEWDLLVRQGRRAQLLGRLAGRLADAGLSDAIPDRPLHHLQAALTASDRVNAAARWEIGQVAEALETLSVPVVVLKGAAYALQDPAVAKGRRFSDLDILVPKSAIEDVERRLRAHGWRSSHLDPYDQRYYREWMHEIPPMQHVSRKTNLDIHHGLLPETVKSRPDPQLLLHDAVPVEGLENVYVLSPLDRWLHSATHLFQEGEFHNALRDLTDLDLLSRQFGKEPGFWDALPARAEQLNLTRQLFYAVWFLDRILGTPLPNGYLSELDPYGPKGMLRRLMDVLYRQAFRPLHPSCDSSWGGIGRLALYIRSHAIRMPPHLLLPHLAHKSIVVPYQEWREAREERKAIQG